MSDTVISKAGSPQEQLPTRGDDTQAAAMRNVESTLSSAGLESASHTQGTLALKEPIPIDRLWETAHGETSNVARALELLKEATEYLTQAKQKDSAVESDRLVQRAQFLLPKLFALRSIGDGFGLIVNSLYYASANLRGTPMRQDQLNCMWRLVRELRARPAMSVEQAVERVEELVHCGLEPDPPEVGDLLDDLESTKNV
jgi:hypothetical protein